MREVSGYCFYRDVLDRRCIAVPPRLDTYPALCLCRRRQLIYSRVREAELLDYICCVRDVFARTFTHKTYLEPSSLQ